MRKPKKIKARNKTEAAAIRKTLRAMGATFSFSRGRPSGAGSRRRRNTSDFKGVKWRIQYRGLRGGKKVKTVIAFSREEARAIARKKLPLFSVITRISLVEPSRKKRN